MNHYTASLLVGLLFSSTLASAAPLQVTPIYTSEQSFNVTASLISGNKQVMLVNGFFNRADALRAAAQILDSGKTLTTIFVSHGDPDYYFGLESLIDIFPKAKVVATAATIAHIEQTQAAKLQFCSPKMGNNAPTRLILPTLASAEHLLVDGETVEIQGSGAKTYLWIPSAKAVVGGITVFGNMHLWMADDAKPADWALWRGALDGIQALKPALVIAGHATANSPTDQRAVTFTQTYLAQYAKANSTSKNSAELIQSMQRLYPDLPEVSNLQMGAKVVKGEMQWH